VRCPPARGKIKGLRSLVSTGEFSMGVLTETKKTPRLSRGGHRPECTDSEKHCFVKLTEYQGRGCVSVEVISGEGYVQL